MTDAAVDRRAARRRLALRVALPLGAAIGIGVPLFAAARAVARDASDGDPLLHPGESAASWLGAPLRGVRTVAEVQGEAAAELWTGAALLAGVLLAVAAIRLGALLAAEALRRRPELALRAALGADRRRLAAELFAEALRWLPAAALVGAVGWTATAFLAVRFGAEGALLRPEQLRPSPGLLVVVLLVPLALWASMARVAGRPDLVRRLPRSGRSTAGPAEKFLRASLASMQVGGAVLLLAVATMLVRDTLARPGPDAAAVPAGRDTLTLRLALPASGVDRSRLLERAVEAVAALPGVREVSVSSPGAWIGAGVTAEVEALCSRCFFGGLAHPLSIAPARIHAVDPGFFAMIGRPPHRGNGDGVVIDETAARALFPGGDPIGQRVRLSRTLPWSTVVGIVGNHRPLALGNGGSAVPTLYLPMREAPPSVVGVAVRAEGDPEGLTSRVRDAIAGSSPGTTVGGVMTMDRYLRRFGAPVHALAGVLAWVAAVSLLVAAGGVASAMADDVERRRPEIALRRVLGATSRRLLALVMARSARIVALGVVAGTVALGVAAAPLHRAFGITPPGPAAVAVIVAGLAVLAVAAAAAPARRAIALDPAGELGER